MYAFVILTEYGSCCDYGAEVNSVWLHEKEHDFVELNDEFYKEAQSFDINEFNKTIRAHLKTKGLRAYQKNVRQAMDELKLYYPSFERFLEYKGFVKASKVDSQSY